MRKIIYTNVDGRLSIVHPVINTLEIITEAAAEQRAWDSLPPEATDARFVDASALPADRTFRDAWQHANGGVSVNLAKAAVVAEKLGVDTQDIATAKTVDDLAAVVDAKHTRPKLERA